MKALLLDKFALVKKPALRNEFPFLPFPLTHQL